MLYLAAARQPQAAAAAAAVAPLDRAAACPPLTVGAAAAAALFESLARSLSLFVDGSCAPGIHALLELLLAAPPAAVGGTQLLAHLLPPRLPLTAEALSSAPLALPPSLLLLPPAVRCGALALAAPLPCGSTRGRALEADL